MHLSRTMTVAAASMAFLTLAASLAEAQTRQRRGDAPPLTIRKRSFLDSGPVVPVGSLRNYVNDNTVLFVPSYRNYAPGRFGGETLPGRFDVPGRPSPLFTF